MGLAEGDIDTLTGRRGFTVIVIALEVAGFPVTQITFEVITQVTIFPLLRVDVVKVVLLVPAFEPFTFH